MLRFFILLTLATFSSFAAPSLTLSNAALQSDFNGKLTHTITGITTGETVFVERIADLNGNGDVDAGETSLRSFNVTDGGQTIIGGVRNQNIPADEDGLANGAIDLRLEFGGLSPILNRQPGKYVIRVTATSGQAKAPFEITAPNLPQRITGVVQNTLNSSPVAFAFVIVLVGDGQPVGSVRADANGVYNILAAPGNYGLIPFADGFIGSFDGAGLAAGQVVTKNLLLNPASVRISGRLSDSSNNAGVPTVFVLAESQSDTISGGLSDANGNYTFTVTPGAYDVHPLSEFGSQLGYLSPNDVAINPTGSPLTVDFSMPRANALIYGTVTDTSNNNAPVAGLRMSGDNQSNLTDFETDGRTSATGDYFIGVIADEWRIQPEDAELLGFASEEHQITISAGQAIRSDFHLARFTAHIRGKVLDARGVGIPNVSIEGQVNGQNNDARAETDSQGNFDLGVSGGDWILYLANTRENGLISRFLPVSVVDGVDQTLNFVVPDPTGHITGFVQNTSGQPVIGVQLHAEATINNVTYQSSAETGNLGAYSLPAINGTWNISVDCQDIQSRGYLCPFNQSAVINNNNATINFTLSPPITTRPTIEKPTLDRTGPTPIFRFVLRGEPGNYYIFGTEAVTGPWGITTSVTIPPGNQTVPVQINGGVYRFFQAQVNQ